MFRKPIGLVAMRKTKNTELHGTKHFHNLLSPQLLLLLSVLLGKVIPRYMKFSTFWMINFSC
jgi:hypothetical protein